MKTKEELKQNIKQMLSKTMMYQWQVAVEDFERFPHLYTDEEHAQMVEMRSAVEELNRELLAQTPV